MARQGGARRVFVDTCVLIDVCSSKRISHGESSAFLRRCLECDEFEPCAMASSLKDVYYVLCRHYLSEADAREAIVTLTEVLTTVDLTKRLVLDACMGDEPDIEDGIVRRGAEKVGACAIVTRDGKAFDKCLVPSLTPGEFLESIA